MVVPWLTPSSSRWPSDSSCRVVGAHYVAFRVGDKEIGLDPNGHTQGMTGPLGSIEVVDFKTALQSLLDSSAHVQHEVKDVSGGELSASAIAPDGSPIGLIQSRWKTPAGSTRAALCRGHLSTERSAIAPGLLARVAGRTSGDSGCLRSTVNLRGVWRRRWLIQAAADASSDAVAQSPAGLCERP